ncbi:protein DPCD [Ctenocephalides felis]|uniref:protein DPCD n=1 Tax=Ctenocephalides felis TaxID=7515 RepID=UPI000E6E1782|nr:protein DPCD [Ctenocephalides felis]XP_026464108.1 protein DPCD [Ctenocephalides felis]XP_026464109.1 protein DPCD [Ctenocephalides felis]XP_026464110.1 protein DPCD [Ctenocephalides felis]XP_026464111.1 protein DPCD [Ctenocephalides felis]
MAHQHEWLSLLRKAEKSSMIQDKVKKIHYKFNDGREMVEEYNTETNVLSRRAWKKNTELGGQGKWVIELGEPLPQQIQAPDTTGIVESNTEPTILKRMTRINIEWRIRNLPYPLGTYAVSADANKDRIIVRTTNKKYYKEIEVPELKRTGLKPEQSRIQINHQFNTLIITYKKPPEVIELEKATQGIIAEAKSVRGSGGGGDMDCKPS